LLTTMPRLPDAGCFWQTNVVPARWRQWSVMMLSTSISNQPAYSGHFPSFRFRGDFFQLLLDEGCCAVIGIGPRHDRCQVLDNVPVIEMALDRRRVRNRQRPQDQSLSLNGRSAFSSLRHARRAHNLAALVPAAIYFWHFGHQKVERPFCVKRRTMPLQPAVWHFSPSRS
jgi:hypothetical protein